MSYARFAPMVASAQSYPALWRLLLGIVTIAGVTIVWMAALFGAYAALNRETFDNAAADLMAPGAPRPGLTALFLLLIGGLGLGAILAARIWQKRPAGSLFGPRVATLRNFGLAAITSFGVMAVLGLMTLPFVDTLEPNLDLGRWLIWLPLALLALAVQTGSEELVFRGYLQSQLAARFKTPLVWLIGPALIFGLVHMQPGLTLPHMLTIILVTTLFGVLAGDLTARTGNIGAAWGFHFANNGLIILLVSNEPVLQGLSLYRTDNPLTEMASFSPLIAFELVTLIAIWTVIRRVLAV